MFQIQAPSGSNAVSSAALTSFPVRREGVAISPTRSARIMAPSCSASAVPTGLSSR